MTSPSPTLKENGFCPGSDVLGEGKRIILFMKDTKTASSPPELLSSGCNGASAAYSDGVPCTWLGTRALLQQLLPQSITHVYNISHSLDKELENQGSKGDAPCGRGYLD